MNENEKRDLLLELLQSLNDDDKMRLHNEIMYELQYDDDEIFYNDDEFFNTYFENRVLEAVRSISYGDYTYTHEFIRFNGYGNLETFNSYNLDDYILYDEIIDYLLENDCELLKNYDLYDDFMETLNDWLDEL
jgi:hypothetical protein